MGEYQNLILIVAMMAAFYVLVIRPQQKRQQEQRRLVDALTAGDEIVTIGGIFATVVSVGERLVVETIDGSRFEISPKAVAQVVPRAERVTAQDDEDSVADGPEDVEARQ